LTSPRKDPPTAAQIAKAKARILRWLIGYFLILAGIGLAVWAATGSVVAGGLTALGLFLLLPWVATALRISYQKRHGLPVRGPWSPRLPSEPT
jgi:hypothetical protein